MAIFNCPQCGHSQSVDDKHIGKSASCPKCKTQGAVQDEATAAVARIANADVIATERGTRSRNGGPAGIFWGLGPKHDYNPGSTLCLEWIVADDPSVKVCFTEVCGPKAVREDRQTLFKAEVEVCCLGLGLSAIDLHFLLFSIWGKHLTTLAGQRIRDFRPDERYKESMVWYARDADAEEFLISIGYVSRVRTSAGVVISADDEFILREARRVSEKFAAEDLEPKPPKKE
jgi:hypothetical protein